MSESLSKLVEYLRAEADFNRSWTDGRRGSFSAQQPGDTYVARRIELARERDHWADEIERMWPVYEAAKAWKESDCAMDCPLRAEGPHAHDCPERIVLMKLADAIDAASPPKEPT